MDLKRSAIGGALAALVCLGLPPNAQGSAQKGRGETGARFSAQVEPEIARFIRSLPGARPVVFANRPQQGGNSRSPGPPAVNRADKPVVAVTAAGAGQAGYVHFFIVEHPDETLEIQVGIETPDQRIAWSFPGLGVVVSPFIEAGRLQAGGKEYYVWHQYGIRPFPNDPAMAALRKGLPGRVDAMAKAGTPYCLEDGPRSNCMSCLGFVLRVLFPGRQGDNYPNLPRDFWRAGYVSKYSTNDLLLYLTGMLDLPTREARLRHLNRLSLPQDMREDVERFVYSMSVVEANAETPQRATPKRSGAAPSKNGVLPAKPKKL
jgi:hypothetical protein